MEATIESRKPTAADNDTGRWETLTGGQFHTCGIKTDDTAWCWGGGQDLNSGQLGDGTRTDRYTPVQVRDKSHWKTISAGQVHTCGIKTDRTAWCWGHNADGRLGVGTTNEGRSAPVQVSGHSHWQAIDAGPFHTCGIKTDHTAWCWGGGTKDHNYGQLGDRTRKDRSTPVQVSGGSHWKAISAGGFHTCGIKTDNTAWCWGGGGKDNVGQLGDGATEEHLTPVQVSGNSHWKTIDTGYRHTCGLKTDNTAWCWGGGGKENSGQLGDGARKDRATPVQVSGDSHWKSIATGIYHTCGIKPDNSAWCWGGGGDLNFGQLGDGARKDRATPVQVSGNSHWKSIGAGQVHTCGIKTDQTAWCWGGGAESFNSGQLGNGTTDEHPKPVHVND